MDVSAKLQDFWDAVAHWLNEVGTVDAGPGISARINREAGLRDVFVEVDHEDLGFSPHRSLLVDSDEDELSEAGEFDEPCNIILDAYGTGTILVRQELLNYIQDTYHNTHMHRPAPTNPPTFAGTTFVSVRVHEGAYLIPRGVLLRVIAVIMEEIAYHDEDNILDTQKFIFDRLLEPDLRNYEELDYTGAEASEVTTAPQKPEIEDDGYFLVCRDSSPVLQHVRELRRRAGHSETDPYTPCAIPYLAVAYLAGQHEGFFDEETTAPDPSSVSAFFPSTPTPSGAVTRIRSDENAPSAPAKSTVNTQARIAESVQWLHHGAAAFSPTVRLDHLLRGPRPRQSQWFILTYPYYLAWVAGRDV